MEKKITLVAGPNGSGKTTFAQSYFTKLPDHPVFLNPDLIASGFAFSDFEKASFQAGRILIKEIKGRIAIGESLSFESTLSGRTWYPILKSAKSQGYEIDFYFIMLKNISLNLSRIKSRVKSGGHNIPKESVIRRHSRVFDNFWNLYRPLSSSWYIFDNSRSLPILKMNNQSFESLNQTKKNKFVKEFLKGRINGA